MNHAHEPGPAGEKAKLGRKTTNPSPPEITALLVASSGGAQDALDRLFPLVYAELHRPGDSSSTPSVSG